MAEATTYSGERGYQIGKVFSQTFSIFKRNAIPFSLVAGVIWMPIGLLDYWGQQQTDPLMSFLAAISLLTFLIILYPLAIAILLHATFQTMRDQPVSLTTSANHILYRLPHLIGLSILAMLGILGGLFIFIVPGLLLLTMWAVSTPVCVVEKCGPIKSLNRSSTLTKGYRWQVFATVMIIMIFSSVISSIVEVGMKVVVGDVATLITLVIWNAIIQAFSAVLTGVMYHDLRIAKEGLDTNRIASVFD